MRNLLSISILFVTSAPAFAQAAPIPEPSVLGLIGIGAVAILVGLRRKK